MELSFCKSYSTGTPSSGYDIQNAPVLFVAYTTRRKSLAGHIEGHIFCCDLLIVFKSSTGQVMLSLL